MNRSIMGCVVFLAVLLIGNNLKNAWGGGIEVPMQDSRASGQADAFIAQADDPAAVFYNPAGLVQLHGNQFSVGVLGLIPDWRFNGSDGSGESMHLPSILPHLYASTDLGTENWRFGIGINNEFGLNEDWGDQGPLRRLVDHAEFSVLNISPAVAYEVDEHLSFGLALNIYYGELTLNREIAISPLLPEGKFHLRGHDWQVGLTPSVLWKINDQNSIGAFYRTGFTLNLEGSTNIAVRGIPEIGPSRAVTPISLPQMVGMGYAIRPLAKLKVEADVIWTDWSVLDQLRIHSPNKAFNGQAIPADWTSGFTYRLGTQYELTKNWTLRAGYAYSQNAIPQSTYSPLVPDSNYHLFSAGLGYGTENWQIDAAFQYIYRETRNIANDVNSPAVDGRWDNTFYGMMVTFTMKL